MPATNAASRMNDGSGRCPSVKLNQHLTEPTHLVKKKDIRPTAHRRAGLAKRTLSAQAPPPGNGNSVPNEYKYAPGVRVPPLPGIAAPADRALDPIGAFAPSPVLQPLAALLHDLRRHLVGTVTARQPHQRLAVALTELLHLAV